VPWTNESGSNARFAWSDGQSDDGGLGEGGLWGDPIVTIEGFFFDDVNPLFRAEAPDADNIVSAMSVNLSTLGADPVPADPLTELHITEWGTYTGMWEEVAASSGTVLLIPISPSGPPTNLGQLTMTHDPDTLSWMASMNIYFDEIGGGFPSEVNILGLDVTNHLIATGTSSIQKTGAKVLVPEPTTAMLVLCGLIPIVSRRRR
jgi:hypothetical protein